MKPSLLVILAGVTLLGACSKPQPSEEPIRAVKVQTVAADAAGGLHEYAAEVRSRTESRLSFRVGGKIVKRAANLGDAVKAGQVLAQLDPMDLRLGQDAARAALTAAQVNHDQASADFKRFKELRDQGFISSAELERRDTSLKSANAQLDQARAQAGMHGNQAAYSALVADASGVITSIDAEPGMVVNAGAPVLRLAHDGPRDVVFSVPEDKVSQLRAAAGALKVKLWGANGETLPGTVREVSAAADPMTRTFLIKADIGRADVKLGQTATVMLELPKIPGITKLPLTAVMEHQGKTAVWLLDQTSMTVVAQPIQVAGAEGNAVLVRAGLTPGQVVVTAGVHVLTAGQKVKLYAQPSPFAATSMTVR